MGWNGTPYGIHPNPPKLCTLAVLSGTFPAPAGKGLVSLASQRQRARVSREVAEPAHPAPRFTKLAAACFLLTGDLVNVGVS